MNLVNKAKEFAVNAHRRIGHRRKYTRLPYATHLDNVATLVASVTDNSETIAAAWLHDVVEDTPATLDDVEREFGSEVALMVESLTDVSRLDDGNRAKRKEMDRQHIASAAAQAKTVKLADLIDNCQDICKNDERFAKQYLKEMAHLLDVLKEGDPELFRQAKETYEECAQKIGMFTDREDITEDYRRGMMGSWRIPPHLVRAFADTFIAQDIAEPLRSFDREKNCSEVRIIMEEQYLDVVLIRDNGLVRGYLCRNDLTDSPCSEHIRQFRPAQVLEGEASITAVIHSLTLHEHVFISVLGEVSGYISRQCVNKPVARMWLFGMITMIEMELTRLIEDHFPQESWIPLVSESRREKADQLKVERERRNQHCTLLECLQLSDKGQILIENPTILKMFGFKSKRLAKRNIKEFESLRNNLAHAQDIATHDWAAIARISSRIAEASYFRKG